ncbi:cytochrome-c oxidase, cbb3-type subunit II [Leptospira yasudae]|uniref:Cytochrome-c oxidase, cbb3-type subunit II n=1 Tax=Leptospira yasudae TaxID=2202201 RepID=A0ABX9M340_9LEPT|nr:cytochrome-c oxidase, cbb3-type subunit II [Leptospira yasudae]RHX80028.1 cytochrome-c oxidase, cbb3-type subunit II [Leptospira yasudae]RHX94023.1 cytochrome-c oxidase, cbb3-type subunit II [Leptospira yasudae]TGK25839.1 cytochrome-c oxidase, cbb3-type subunit II [Leptospira yasudae]TGM02939.1 cytochrome-c oxidase, cbb3-type subunit II [Leptospira yasudae]
MKLFDSLLTWFSGFTEKWEKQGVKFTVYTTIAVLIGGIFELIPPFFISRTAVPIQGVKPFSALELAGRDIYQKEGCNNCHTQMIRPFKWEVDRFDPSKSYGRDGYSKAGEFVYDHPFLWGSKRTGPDLAHESQIQPSYAWHKTHLINPRDTSPGSVMPAYPWLFEESARLDAEKIVNHMKGLSKIGVPYSEADYLSAAKELEGKTEGDALIAYLLKLGKDTAELSKSIQ